MRSPKSDSKQAIHEIKTKEQLSNECHGENLKNSRYPMHREPIGWKSSQGDEIKRQTRENEAKRRVRRSQEGQIGKGRGARGRGIISEDNKRSLGCI